MKKNKYPSVFTPNNEPYLGRTLLYNLDKIIISLMEQNSIVAPSTFKIKLNDHQRMACIVVPQIISLSLSIRELIRQGYLFGANVLIRPVIERTSILMYLNYKREEIRIWNNGWNHKEAPSLSKMIEEIQKQDPNREVIPGFKITGSMNDLTHGKPDSAIYNTIHIDNEKHGYATSKLLDSPNMCDEICAIAISQIAITQAMINLYFNVE